MLRKPLERQSPFCSVVQAKVPALESSSPSKATKSASGHTVRIPWGPSEYFHRNFVCTFITDQIGIQLRHDIGVKNMAWSTDFPHHGCDWPYSRKVAFETLVGVPQAERHDILAGNMVRIYRLLQSLDVPL